MSTINKKEIRHLQSIDYVLCEHDVYCGRGNLCFHHIGNRKFRKIIIENLNRYSIASRKYEKSSIIDEVVDQVRDNCRQYNGVGFVRKDTKTGRFYEVGNFIAREKTSQAFRDALIEKSNHNNKSANKSSATETKHTNSLSIICQSDEENNDNCHYDVSSEKSSTSSCHSFEHADDPWKCPSALTESYASILDLFSLQNKSDQQSYPNNSTTKNSLLRSTEESSIILEPIHVQNNIVVRDDEFNIDSIIDNGRIQTRSTNFDNFTSLLDNDLYSFLLNINKCYVDNDSNHQTSPIKISSSQTTNSQVQFTKTRRIEDEISNYPKIISDDEKTFNLLLQLTESYPDVKQYPFLLSTII